MTDDDPHAGEGADGRDFIFRGDDTPTDWDARTDATPPPSPSQSGPPPSAGDPPPVPPEKPPLPPPGSPPPAPPATPPPAPPATPPPAPPGNAPPPAPPGTAPPAPPGGPGQPPPGSQPPPAPPGSGYAIAEQPRKKRWPWVVAAVVLLCALPLGGCVALIAFGISEIEEREDAIETVADDFMNRAIDDGSPDATNLMDGGAGCLTPADFTAALDNEIVAADEWSSDDISFVDRTGNGYLSNTSDPESFVYGGREDDGFAIVTGRLLLDGVTEQDLQVLLLKPGNDWRVCTLELL